MKLGHCSCNCDLRVVAKEKTYPFFTGKARVLEVILPHSGILELTWAFPHPRWKEDMKKDFTTITIPPQLCDGMRFIDFESSRY